MGCRPGLQATTTAWSTSSTSSRAPTTPSFRVGRRVGGVRQRARLRGQPCQLLLPHQQRPSDCSGRGICCCRCGVKVRSRVHRGQRLALPIPLEWICICQDRRKPNGCEVLQPRGWYHPGLHCHHSPTAGRVTAQRAALRSSPCCERCGTAHSGRCSSPLLYASVHLLSPLVPFCCSHYWPLNCLIESQDAQVSAA